MIPIRLNLLSPRKRGYTQRLVYAQFFRNISEITVFLLSIICITLLGGNWVLQTHIHELAENLTAMSHQQTGKNKRIRAADAIVEQTDRLQKQYTLWSDMLPLLIATVPADVTLSELTLDMPKKEYVFAGVAKTRNGLLALQRNLESLPFVDTASVPISQLIGTENISFSITVRLHPS